MNYEKQLEYAAQCAFNQEYLLEAAAHVITDRVLEFLHKLANTMEDRMYDCLFEIGFRDLEILEWYPLFMELEL